MSTHTQTIHYPLALFKFKLCRANFHWTQLCTLTDGQWFEIMDLPKLPFTARKVLVIRFIHLVFSWDWASVLYLLPKIRKLKNLMDGWVAQRLNWEQRSYQVIIHWKYVALNTVIIKIVSYNKDYFLRIIVLSLVAVPEFFPYNWSNVIFKCHMLEMSHVLNIQIVI